MVKLPGLVIFRGGVVVWPGARAKEAASDEQDDQWTRPDLICNKRASEPEVLT